MKNNFKVGDKVRVIKAPLYFEEEFTKGCFEGLEYILEDGFWKGVYFPLNGGGMCYIMSGEIDCLELVEDEPEGNFLGLKLTVVDDQIRIGSNEDDELINIVKKEDGSFNLMLFDTNDYTIEFNSHGCYANGIYLITPRAVK